MAIRDRDPSPTAHREVVAHAMKPTADVLRDASVAELAQQSLECVLAEILGAGMIPRERRQVALQRSAVGEVGGSDDGLDVEFGVHEIAPSLRAGVVPALGATLVLSRYRGH